MWIAGLVLLLAADARLEPILAVVDARDGALRSFAARYYETIGGERMGPRFFAWSAERSLYRGPKCGHSFAVQRWWTGERVRRESIYYKDMRQVIWLRRELQPMKLVWQGTRTKSTGPWIAEESGLFWQGKLLSELLRERDVRILGREPVNGHPCLKLMVVSSSGEFPDLLWLAEDCDYFPCRAVQHKMGHPRAETVDSATTPDQIRIGETCYSPTAEFRWEELRRAGPIWYPRRVRITNKQGGTRLIEAVPGSVRFNEQVTEADFDLPWLYFVHDSLDRGYAAVTPFLRVTLEGAAAVAALVLLGGLAWRRRRRRRAAA